jgi:hypothetical protein
MSETIEISTLDGVFSAYVAKPDAPSGWSYSSVSKDDHPALRAREPLNSRQLSNHS